MSAARWRLAVGLEYDGARFAGWQLQPGLATIQGHVQRALGSVADHPVEATCAGRTDAAVHASGQVAHFDTTSDRPMRGWVLGANAELPPEIAVLWAVDVDPEFHARHSAVARSYRYCLLQRATRPALLRERVWWLRSPLDAAAMHQAAQQLVGEHDFSAFRAAECQSKTTRRRIDSISVHSDGELVTIEVTANAFLHHMVRNIVGTLVPVGTGEQRPSWVGEVLASGERARAGITAPAHGLYLERVRYPPALGIPEFVPLQPWAMIAGQSQRGPA
ncbi:MAG: tRNA pseudouridine(38-40) synthase TruA [Gammaproteobacteria bacterium]|nr:tRNA pseudouridine(38-40) synthase TruA [Gammaproteobacteria bacterium]